MEGYEVITSDDHKIGHVVTVDRDWLIVEHGHLKHTRHAIPKSFARADQGERVVRLSVSKELVDGSPKVENGAIDHRAVAEHYGLAAGGVTPETLGEGDLLPDDPAWSAEQEESRLGREPATERRARMLKHDAPLDRTAGRPIIPPDPHE